MALSKYNCTILGSTLEILAGTIDRSLINSNDKKLDISSLCIQSNYIFKNP